MTTTELRPSWSERLNPRNWTLAWKLVAIGLVPALLALGLGVLRIADQAEAAAALGSSNRLLEIRGQVADSADALRQERDEAALYVAAGRTEDRGVLDIGITQTDELTQRALTTLRSSTEFDATTRAAQAQAEQALAQLAPLRAEVGTGSDTNADAVVQRYTGMIARVDGLDRALLRQLRAPDVAGLADALTATTSAEEQLAIQHTVLGVAIRSSQLRPDDVAASVAADNRLASEVATYQIALTPEQLTRFGTFGGTESNGEFTRVKNLILDTPLDRPVVVDPAEWDAAYSTALAAVQSAGDLIRDEIASVSAAAEERASNLAGINSVILMLGLLIGITIAVLVARALIRSLRVLRTSALDVAERRLPQAVESMRAGETPDVTVDPVPLDSRDEVGQVARAFDAVHGQAVRLAADQAALQTNVSSMFVNLSRRSQALVERQLQLIEQLESNEQDPDQLSNLFQLDHLATRMRRNSENLLVLAGTDLAKRNIAPVPMVDVLRAAVSEIEQYQRIVVQSPPTTTIVGRAASDLVHLLAELLDNATNFSPPDSQVVMSTTRTAEGAILVEIADRGVGMIDYELADANQRLGGPSAVDVSASRRMGLFVVGRLGARHGIQVQLSTSTANGPGTGLTASVTVPAHLVPTVEGERPDPVRTEAPVAQTPSAFEVPPQRAAVNGSGRAGSLSALVAGADGPMSPPSAFDPGPGGDGRTSFPSVNGSSGPQLPTRRPGSSLDPADGFGRSGDRDGSPSPAEQARQDQLAAERAEADRRDDSEPDTTSYPIVGQAPRDERGTDDGGTAEAEHDAGVNGAAVPHVAAHALGAPVDSGNGTSPDDDADDGDAADDASGDSAGDDSAGVDRSEVVAYDSDRDADLANEAHDDGPTTRSGASRHSPWPHEAPPHGDGSGAHSAVERPSPLPQRRPAPRPAQAGEDETVERGYAQRAARQPAAPPTAPLPMVGASPEQDRVQPPAAQAPVSQAPVAQPAPVQPPPVQPAPPIPPVAADREQQPSAELFAPSVPAVAEPAPAAPETMAPRPPDQGTGFEMGETTPIFEEIASAWFRSNRPLPVEYEDEAPPAPSPRVRPRPAAARPQPRIPADESLSPPQRRPQPYQQQAFTPQPAPPVAPPRRRAPAAELPTPTPTPVTEQESVDQAGFASTADEGWRAASNASPTERPDELTSAGLPKRRPRARLVPGSAGSAVLAPPVSPARSAESVRGRLASYQQGVRQGRESRYRGDTGAQQGNGRTEPANAGGNHDEERP